MTIMKTLSVIAVLSAAIAAPVFAFAGEPGPGSHFRMHRGLTHHHVRDQHFRGAYNQHNERFDPYQRNTEDFGFRGRDPSRIGGENPDLHPSAY